MDGYIQSLSYDLFRSLLPNSKIPSTVLNYCFINHQNLTHEQQLCLTVKEGCIESLKTIFDCHYLLLAQKLDKLFVRIVPRSEHCYDKIISDSKGFSAVSLFKNSNKSTTKLILENSILFGVINCTLLFSAIAQHPFNAFTFLSTCKFLTTSSNENVKYPIAPAEYDPEVLNINALDKYFNQDIPVWLSDTQREMSALAGLKKLITNLIPELYSIDKKNLRILASLSHLPIFHQDIFGSHSQAIFLIAYLGSIDMDITLVKLIKSSVVVSYTPGDIIDISKIKETPARKLSALKILEKPSNTIISISSTKTFQEQNQQKNSNFGNQGKLSLIINSHTMDAFINSCDLSQLIKLLSQISLPIDSILESCIKADRSDIILALGLLSINPLQFKINMSEPVQYSLLVQMSINELERFNNKSFIELLYSTNTKISNLHMLFAVLLYYGLTDNMGLLDWTRFTEDIPRLMEIERAILVSVNDCVHRLKPYIKSITEHDDH